MANSTQPVRDIQNVIATGPTAATLANSRNANGPIIDYVGVLHSINLGLQEQEAKLKNLIQVTDSTLPDPNLAVLTGVLTLLQANATIGLNE